MIDAETFTAGMQGIAAGVRKVWEAASIGVYFDALGHQTDAVEWDAFVRWANSSGRWQWLPTLREIIDAIREFRGDPPLLAEATEAYERVLASGVYAPEGGTSWIYRNIQERCGEAASEAFMAAGGTAAFTSTWDEAKRRERFVAAYSEAVRESPGAKLLPSAGTKALPPAESESRALTAEEARAVMRGVVGTAPQSQPKQTRVVATDERLAALERQKQQILAEPKAQETVSPEEGRRT